MISGLPLMKKVFIPLAKTFLISFELMAAASETDAAIHKKVDELGMATLIISNEEMKDIMKIVASN